MKSAIYIFVCLTCFNMIYGQGAQPMAHGAPMMAYMDHLESIVLVGEQTEKFDYNRTWLWNEGWTEVKTEHSPGQRTGHAIAYDSKRKLLVLFGGSGKGINRPDNTWVFDGVDWRELNIPAPPRRHKHRMVYDEKNDRIVLTGGSAGLSKMGDTWVFNGKEWKQLDGLIPARSGHTMVYDIKKKRVVLHGGRYFNVIFSDTWILEGDQWKLLNIIPPLKRDSHSMVYDESRSRVIIFGGKNSIPLRDSWSLSDEKWVLRDNTGPRRVAGAFVFHRKLNKIILFGGYKAWEGATNEVWSCDFRTWILLSNPEK